MLKTNAIQLVLITAAMAACNHPLYQRPAAGYEDPEYSTDASAGSPTAGPGPRGTVDADAPDSTNSCPVESSWLPPDYYDWYNGSGPFGSVTVNFNINGYYAYHNPPPLVRVNPIRSLFTRTFASIAAAHVRTIPASTHPGVARSGFGARIGAAAHS
jgi:hypothetical protein